MFFFCSISNRFPKLNSGRPMGIIFSEQMFVIQFLKEVSCFYERQLIITVMTKTSSFLDVVLRQLRHFNLNYAGASLVEAL
jgi:hypothetical protein